MCRFTVGRAFAFGASLFLLVVHPTNAQQKPEWTWKDGEGRSHTRAELNEILEKNRDWVKSGEKSGESANLFHANLSGANLSGVNLIGAFLEDANLSDANLYRANLYRADLGGANLSRANLKAAYLIGAFLEDANLILANLIGANLADARLREAQLKDASLRWANLSGATFEPKSLPEVRGIAAASNLELVTYGDSPDALVQLRKQFQDGGFREQERKITYALKRREAELLWEGCKARKTGDKTRAILWSADSNLANCGSFILNRVFFDWTCQYGMSPGRPLSLGVVLWLLCSLVYFGIIHTSSSKTGLFRVYHQSLELEADPSAHKEVIRIQAQKIAQHSLLGGIWEFLVRECSLLLPSMFFSLMSAFNIGFRDINFGRWLRLLTRQEFDMKAVGWARVVAGWQSLISVYFIALWVLTYFGRPFG